MKNIFNQKIIDTHHHLWDSSSNKYDWLTAPGHEALNKLYLFENYTEDFNGLKITKSVHVQAEINLSESIFETEWLQNISNSNSSLQTLSQTV